MMKKFTFLCLLMALSLSVFSQTEAEKDAQDRLKDLDEIVKLSKTQKNEILLLFTAEEQEHATKEASSFDDVKEFQTERRETHETSMKQVIALLTEEQVATYYTHKKKQLELHRLDTEKKISDLKSKQKN